jgi:hypothetical protein
MIESKRLDLAAMFTILLATPHSIISITNCLWLSDSMNIKGELPGNWVPQVRAFGLSEESAYRCLIDVNASAVCQ